MYSLEGLWPDASEYKQPTCYNGEKTKKLSLNTHLHRSLVMRKPAFSICKNKDADQLRGNREADQRLSFRYTDSTIPLLPIS